MQYFQCHQVLTSCQWGRMWGFLFGIRLVELSAFPALEHFQFCLFCLQMPNLWFSLGEVLVVFNNFEWSLDSPHTTLPSVNFCVHVSHKYKQLSLCSVDLIICTVARPKTSWFCRALCYSYGWQHACELPAPIRSWYMRSCLRLWWELSSSEKGLCPFLS